jgi:hypothetical protein
VQSRRATAQGDHPMIRLSLAAPLDHLIDEPSSLVCAAPSAASRSTAHAHVPQWPPDLSPDCSAFVAYSALIVTSL